MGNYLGAISNWVTLQEQAHSANETLLFSVVDLHAITMPQDPNKLRKERREMAITLLACGIDPKKCILFEQSKVETCGFGGVCCCSMRFFLVLRVELLSDKITRAL